MFFQERPRERCLRHGPACLSLRECIALILNSGPPGVGSLGLASRILGRPGEGLDPEEEVRAFFTAMESTGTAPLAGIPGLGDAGRARLLAAFELGRRNAGMRLPPRKGRSAGLAGDPRRAALSKIPPALRSGSHEWLGFVPLHRGGAIGEFCLVERGTRTHVNVDPAELFARVLALRPHGFYLFHNHPSGSPEPSGCDLELTRKVDQVARALGLKLHGHGIVTAQLESWVNSH